MSFIGKLAAGLSAAALSLLTAQAPAHAQAKLNVGFNAPIALFWPHYIAEDKGFFKEAGITAEAVFSGGSAPSVQQLIGGSLDAIYVSCTPGLQAIDKGAKIAVIGELMGGWPYSVMTPSSVKSAADMVGKKVMLATPSDLTTVFWRRWLKQQGVDPTKVDEVFDAATPNRYAALASGAVAGSLVTQPFDFVAKTAGYQELFGVPSVSEGYSFVCVMMRNNSLQSDAATAKGFLAALSKATNWLYQPQNAEEAKAILTKWSKGKPEDIALTYDYYMKIKPYTANLKIDNAGMENSIKALQEVGQMSAGRKASDFLDLKYLP